MTKITLIVGLPGSGKTHYARNVLQSPVIDDINSIEQLPVSGDFAIIDVNFCDANIMRKAKDFLMTKYDNVEFVEIYFENDPEKARANVIRRNDGRNVEGTIKRFTAIYMPPINCLPIYNGE